MFETWLGWAIAVWAVFVMICAILISLVSIFGKRVKPPIEERGNTGPRIISMVRQDRETLISVEYKGRIVVMQFFTTWSNPVEDWKKQLDL